jgi:hypothetical protein
MAVEKPVFLCMSLRGAKQSANGFAKDSFQRKVTADVNTERVLQVPALNLRHSFTTQWK